jgi:hypothetical protein
VQQHNCRATESLQDCINALPQCIIDNQHSLLQAINQAMKSLKCRRFYLPTPNSIRCTVTSQINTVFPYADAFLLRDCGILRRLCTGVDSGTGVVGNILGGLGIIQGESLDSNSRVRLTWTFQA